MRLRILADDLTGALDCAAAFGAGVPVQLGAASTADSAGIIVVATATRDVPTEQLPDLLQPSLPWLQGADLAFKKVDSLLRGNTLEEVDWLAKQGGFKGVAMVPAFPAQGRITEDGQQWWLQPNAQRTTVALSLRQSFAARTWSVRSGPYLPAAQSQPTVWVPDVCTDADMDAVAAQALHGQPGWLWCGSAGLAHALARARTWTLPSSDHAPEASSGPLMLVSASHHAVTREQWQGLRQSRWAAACSCGIERAPWHFAHADALLMDLSAKDNLTPWQAARLLAEQVSVIAEHAPKPRTLVVVGGDTFLALCQALGTVNLQSESALPYAGWGCARMVGGRWDGLMCHTRSGALGGPADLQQVLDSL